ncbi:MAG: LysR family transcriptional regulator [Rhodobacterales bacterium]|nr:LysR family transcriptional regulator [Rhodobacterales bacterium]
MDKPLHSLDWSLVQVFLTVAETGSLSAAARALGASQPTLGRQIRQIEAKLSAELFTRQPRGLTLTDTGQALVGPATRMRDAMAEITMTAAGKQTRVEGTVRITTSEVVSHYILPPIIARIRQAEPLISIDILPSDTSENLLFREADIAVRMYRSEQLDIITRKIGDLEIGVFAAKSYLDHNGRPKTAMEMLDYDLIGFDRVERIIRGMRDLGIDANRDMFQTRTHGQAVYWELIRAGCGIGMALALIGDIDPTVERLHLGIAIDPMPVWLATHQGMRQTPRIRRVWDMLNDGLTAFVS